MSWLDDFRNRKDKSAGKYKVSVNGTEITVPLIYPTAKSKADIVERIRQIEKEKNAAKVVLFVDEIDMMMLKACIDVGDATDEEIEIISKESGGRSGELIKRCSRLLGLDLILSIGSDEKR